MRKPSPRVLLVLLAAVGIAMFGPLSLSPRRQKTRVAVRVDPAEERQGEEPAAATAAAAAAAATAGERGASAVTIVEKMKGEQEGDQSDEINLANPDSGAKALPLSLASKVHTGPGLGPLNLKYIALIAERHSGSTWMVQFLQSYFRGKNITVTPTLCTWKHWFQDRIHQDIQDGKRTCVERQQCPACKDINHTLVVVIWRNPYDWISGMHKIPWHANAHANIADMSKFMTMRWMMDPEDERVAREEAIVKTRDNAPCIDNFLPSEVLPCRPRDDSAIYELDPNGEAYANVYELRKAKYRDFNEVKTWAPYYEKILYEDILVGNGLRDWLISLETLYGLSGNYKNVPELALAKKMAASRSHMYYLNSENCVPACKMGGALGRSALETMHRLWDDEIEGDIGYHRVQ